MGFAERIRRLLPRRSKSQPSSTPDPEPGTWRTEPCERIQQSTVKAYHKHYWNDLSKEGKLVSKPGSLNHGGGPIFVLLLRSKGIGKTFLTNLLIHGDVRGDVSYDPTGPETTAEYFCAGYTYSVDFSYQCSHYPALLQMATGLGVILAYDILSRESWEEVVRLQRIVAGAFEAENSSVPVLILGLKADLGGREGRVPRSEAEAFARTHGYRYEECSSRTGERTYEAVGMFVDHTHIEAMGHDGDAAEWRASREPKCKAFGKVVEASFS